MPKPEIKPDEQACLKDPRANFAAAQEHEQRGGLLRPVGQRSPEDRVKEVFTALTEVETYHIALSRPISREKKIENKGGLRPPLFV